MVTNVVRSKFMKVVSRVGCKHLQGSISNVTISKQDHKKKIFIFSVGSGLGKNHIRADTVRVRTFGPQSSGRISAKLKIGQQKIALNHSFDFLSHYQYLGGALERVFSLRRKSRI